MLKESRAMIASGLFSEVVVAAKWEPGLKVHDVLCANIRVVRIKMHTLDLPKRRLFQLVKYFEWRRALLTLAKDLIPTAVVAHSLGPLAGAVSVKRQIGCRLVYDAHELETERNGLAGLSKLADKWIEKKLIPNCDSVVVVCDSIADWYEKQYRIRRPVVVRNVPERTSLNPRPNPRLWRDRFGIREQDLVFIYQGGLFRGRRIEQFLRVFAKAREDRHIVFMGFGGMQSEVENAAKQYRNIHYTPAVKPDEVLYHTAGADVGLVGVANVCLSYYYSLPNKLFEFMLAGIPALMPKYPEMMRVTEGSGCGWVVGEEDEDWLAAIDNLTHRQVVEGKEAARIVASNLSWQKEATTYVEELRRVL